MKTEGNTGNATLYLFLLYLLIHPICLYSQEYYYLQERLEILEEKVFWLEQLLSNQIDSLKKNHGQNVPDSTLSKRDEYSNTSKKYSSGTNLDPENGEENISSTYSINSGKSKTSSTDIMMNRASMKNLIKTRVFKKTWESSKSGGKMSILLAFTNTTPQDIVAFKGDIVLQDYIGNDITRFFVEINKRIPSYSSKSWFGEIPYTYQNLKNDITHLQTMGVDDLMAILEPKEILFSDGTRKITQ